MRNILETLAPTANQNCTNHIHVAFAVSGNIPPQRQPQSGLRGVGEIGRDSQIAPYLYDRPCEDLRLT